MAVALRLQQVVVRWEEVDLDGCWRLRTAVGAVKRRAGAELRGQFRFAGVDEGLQSVRGSLDIRAWDLGPTALFPTDESKWIAAGYFNPDGASRSWDARIALDAGVLEGAPAPSIVGWPTEAPEPDLVVTCVPGIERDELLEVFWEHLGMPADGRSGLKGTRIELDSELSTLLVFFGPDVSPDDQASAVARIEKDPRVSAVVRSG